MKTASPDTPEASRTVNIAMLSADAFARIAENLTGCGRITAPQADALTRFLTESRRRRLSPWASAAPPSAASSAGSTTATSEPSPTKPPSPCAFGQNATAAAASLSTPPSRGAS